MHRMDVAALCGSEHSQGCNKTTVNLQQPQLADFVVVQVFEKRMIKRLVGGVVACSGCICPCQLLLRRAKTSGEAAAMSSRVERMKKFYLPKVTRAPPKLLQLPSHTFRQGGAIILPICIDGSTSKDVVTSRGRLSADSVPPSRHPTATA